MSAGVPSRRRARDTGVGHDDTDRPPALGGVEPRDDDALALRGAVDLAELAGHPVIGWPSRSAPRFFDEIVAARRRAGFELDITGEATDVVGALGRVAAGFGVHLLPEPAFHRYAPGLPRLRWRPLAGSPLVMRTSAAVDGSRRPGAAAAALWGILEDRGRDTGGA